MRVEGSNSPARLARSLVRNLDEPFVQRQIVADGVLPAGIASVVDPGPELCTLIGPDPSRYYALIDTTPALLCHKEPAQGTQSPQ